MAKQSSRMQFTCVKGYVTIIPATNLITKTLTGGTETLMPLPETKLETKEGKIVVTETYEETVKKMNDSEHWELNGIVPKGMDRINYFGYAAGVRTFLKEHGFDKVKVKYSDNPFGGEGKFFVTLTDIPAGTCLIHSSGSQIETTTFSDNSDVASRIGKLREILKGTNARVNH